MLQLAKGLPPVPRTNIPKREGLQVAGMSRVAVIALDRRMNPLAFHTASRAGDFSSRWESYYRLAFAAPCSRSDQMGTRQRKHWSHISEGQGGTESAFTDGEEGYTSPR